MDVKVMTGKLFSILSKQNFFKKQQKIFKTQVTLKTGESSTIAHSFSVKGLGSAELPLLGRLVT
jgi:hypothetical protein